MSEKIKFVKLGVVWEYPKNKKKITCKNVIGKYEIEVKSEKEYLKTERIFFLKTDIGYMLVQVARRKNKNRMFFSRDTLKKGEKAVFTSILNRNEKIKTEILEVKQIYKTVFIVSIYLEGKKENILVEKI